MPAVATTLPDRHQQFCQAHYLRHLAEPLAAADAACKGALRTPVRQQGGAWLRQAPQRPPGHGGGLTVTGLWPSPGAEPMVPPCPRPTPAAAPTTSEPAAEQVSTQLGRHPRYLLTLKGRPPLRLAGLETDERLSHVAGMRLD